MLDTLNQDVLEHIAYYASTHVLLGPPSDLVPLLAVSRSTNASLHRSTNPHLYARIFAAKFDLTAPRRRLARLYGSDPRPVLSANALAEELVRRFAILKRLRAELDARSSDPESDSETDDGSCLMSNEVDPGLDELMWTAFLMVLEDEGRNTAQLRDARIEAWLAVYWFDAQGASGAIRRLAVDRWPIDTYSKDLGHKIRLALGMWLFWLFLNPAAYVANPDLYRRAERILKLVALNAPLYPLSHFAWTSFRPEPPRIHFGVPGIPSSEPIDPRSVARSRSQKTSSSAPLRFMYFGRELPPLAPLPLAVPANLALLSLQARSRRNADTLEGGLELLELIGPSLAEPFVAFPENLPNAEGGVMQRSNGEEINGKSDVSLSGISSKDESQVHADSYRWEFDWLRCVYAVSQNGAYPDGSIGQGLDPPRRMDTRRYKTYQLGSLEGSWEGPFTYTEFHSFATLLSGAGPSKLQDCLIAQHNQTWRLREYHLLSLPSPRSKYPSASPSRKNGANDEPIPLPVGDAISAHFPDGVTSEDDSAALHLRLPSSFSPPPSLSSMNPDLLPRTYSYTRCRGYHPSVSGVSTNGKNGEEEEDEKSYASRVVDILLSGEGHSGWGEFTLLGRVRPADGFICVMKTYTGGDRGRWLYRGYLVGDGTAHSISPPEFNEGESKGYIAGRWRDMLSAAETHGYEGAFAMARRR